MRLKPLFTPDIIQGRVNELGARISRDFKDQPVVAVCVLKGAVIFYADIIRSLSIETEMDFVRISSYGDQTVSNGNVIFSKDLEIPVKGKHVLIVEDIIDTGRSISCLKRVFEDKNPESISLCALIDKHERREVQVKLDYAGFVLQEGFIVGYGMDCAEKYRNLTGIFQLIPEE